MTTSTGTEPVRPPPGVKMVEPHYGGSWLCGLKDSSGGAAAGDQAAHNSSKAADIEGSSTDPSGDAKANALKGKLKARLDSWRSSMEEAKKDMVVTCLPGVNFLSGE